ncbi:MAG: hypothetical protein K2N37_09110, partial [Lachnospiraceae bacterium]|nr:hypothetical protein [Lachnospiraceae bacterium]
MKKCVKKTAVLGMAGILFLTGCGGTDSAPANEEYAWEEPAGTMPEYEGYTSGMTDVSESGMAAEAPAAEAPTGATSAADMGSEADMM